MINETLDFDIIYAFLLFQAVFPKALKYNQIRNDKEKAGGMEQGN